jgi:sulfite reductase alpha subunit-like flavoprotein
MGGRVVLYASEQGTSKAVAEEIGNAVHSNIVDLKEFNYEDLETYDLVIFVVPSYGRGQCPESYVPAWEKFKNRTTPLTKMKFAVWACGSSAFKKSFVGFGKEVEKKMLELGATKVMEMGIKDEQGEDNGDVTVWANWVNTNASK